MEGFDRNFVDKVLWKFSYSRVSEGIRLEPITSEVGFNADGVVGNGVSGSSGDGMGAVPMVIGSPAPVQASSSSSSNFNNNSMSISNPG